MLPPLPPASDSTGTAASGGGAEGAQGGEVVGDSRPGPCSSSCSSVLPIAAAGRREGEPKEERARRAPTQEQLEPNCSRAAARNEQRAGQWQWADGRCRWCGSPFELQPSQRARGVLAAQLGGAHDSRRSQRQVKCGLELPQQHCGPGGSLREAAGELREPLGGSTSSMHPADHGS